MIRLDKHPRSSAKIADRTDLPQGDLSVVCRGPERGPHNRCHHATALPAGYRRCTGDPGCPIFLPTHLRTTLCPYHEFAGAVQNTTAYEQLMDARTVLDPAA